jgi:carotenoid cleavage dioxygenase
LALSKRKDGSNKTKYFLVIIKSCTIGTLLIGRTLDCSNISLLPLNKRLFALWEGGSAYEINPKTLATIGIQSWSPQTKGLPDKIRDQLSRHHTQMHFKSIEMYIFLNHFQITRSWR